MTIVDTWDHAKAPTEQRRLWLTADVAKAFRVDPQTVKNWLKDPERCADLGAFKTPGGHWRFLEERVRAQLGEP